MRMSIIIFARGPSCSYIHVVKLSRQKASNVSSAVHLKRCMHVIFSCDGGCHSDIIHNCSAISGHVSVVK